MSKIKFTMRQWLHIVKQTVGTRDHYPQVSRWLDKNYQATVKVIGTTSSSYQIEITFKDPKKATEFMLRYG